MNLDFLLRCFLNQKATTRNHGMLSNIMLDETSEIMARKTSVEKKHRFVHEISPVTWGQAERQRAQLQQKNGSALRRQNEQRQCCFFFRILARFLLLYLSRGVITFARDFFLISES